MSNSKIGLGGGCHWCTEAVFQAIIGVEMVEQGYLNSIKPYNEFSEGVIVHFNSEVIDLKTLIEIHLYTHQSTFMHSMRNKYRSAVYIDGEDQNKEAEHILQHLQSSFEKPIITKVLLMSNFKASRDEITNYYSKNPEKVFCKRYIEPKLNLLMEKFSEKLVNRRS